MPATSALPPGYRLHAHDTLDSTNEEATRLARDGAPAGTVVWALRQTAGRGRTGRSWTSEAGNLLFSLLLRPDVPPAAAAQLSFVAALALGEAVSEVLPAGVDLRYKWPNDLLLDGRKAAGILLESAGATGCGLNWLIVGWGLNIASFPETTEGYPATSLAEAGAVGVDAGDVLARVLRRFDAWQARWKEEGLAAVRGAWLERAARVGEEISVRLPRDRLVGRFRGLDENGALVLDLADGTSRTITAGDVFF